MATINNPHDRFFRAVFSRGEVAESFLRHYLPPAIVETLDLSTLTLSHASFVDADLQQHHSDLLYALAQQLEKSQDSLDFLSVHF